MPASDIIIKGAREHNLRDVSLVLPRNQLICLTGVSGSGKSSLAFDTVFAEGQRRYIESLSTFARQFLGQLPKPDVDVIQGLSPSISISQKSTGHNPRSTVGTVTEIYDYLRLLFARVGQGFCPQCQQPITAQSREQILISIVQLPADSKFAVHAPLIRAQKGEHRELFVDLLKQGFSRVRVDGRTVALTDVPALDRQLRHTIEVVVDRFVLSPDVRPRLTEAIESALKLGEGALVIDLEADGGSRDIVYSSQYACTPCGLSFAAPTTQLFSFNSPQGMCEACHGLGTKFTFDPKLLIPSPEKTIRNGCIEPLGTFKKMERYLRLMFEQVAEILESHFELETGAILETPWNEVPAAAQQILLWGTGTETIPLPPHIAQRQGGKQMRFAGVIPGYFAENLGNISKKASEKLERYMAHLECSDCAGQRLRPQARSVRLTTGSPQFHGQPGRSLPEVCELSIRDAVAFFDGLQLDANGAMIAAEVLKEIRSRLGFLLNVGLDYLTLARAAPTLSGGETQRIRLASQIGSGLVGVLYILDEPSIGLHPRDNDRLLGTLQHLRDMGNTVIVVEHDEDTMRAADRVIDFGPGPGVRGGHIVASGTARDIAAEPTSLTGQYLSGRTRIEIPRQRRPIGNRFLEILGAAHNNLKNIDVRIPLGAFVCITGVSGSGKSSLVTDILVEALRRDLNGGEGNPGKFAKMLGLEHLDKLIDIDQSPIGRTPRSNPATYIKVLDEIRDLFTQMPEAKQRGFKPGRFSFNVTGGRCEACEGNGSNKLEMDFLADVWVTCPVCEGHRFNRETLQVRFKDKSIHDVLEMDVPSALELFDNVPTIRHKLETLRAVGLDYLKLGQPSPTLSGGEAQRVKLARELVKRSTGKTLYLLDEPTTGLHFADIHLLLNVLHNFVDSGNTVLVVEHNLDVIKTADWVIDMGPEGGAGGGTIIAQGTPDELAHCEHSYTGQSLRKHLQQRPLEITTSKKRATKKTPEPAPIELKPQPPITVVGARQHNLKNVDVTVPRDRMTVFCGPSGSGKSSLAMDTIYAEGQRRYVESLSSYARQFVAQMQKPQLESIDGLSPAVAIEQKNLGHTPRSTVGTVTEIYDYLRVLMARLGSPFCPKCQIPIGTQTVDEVTDTVLAMPAGTRLYLLAPIQLDGGRTYEQLWDELRSTGYVRVRIDGYTFSLDKPPELDRRTQHTIEVVVDRVVVQPAQRSRLTDSIEKTLSLGKGIMQVAVVEEKMLESRWEVITHSQHLACRQCGDSFEPLTPHRFSFNTQLGWCTSCQGLGTQRGANPAQLIRDPKLTLRQGVLRLWPGLDQATSLAMLEAMGREVGLPLDVPFELLPGRFRRLILHGTGDIWFTVEKPFPFRFQYKGMYPALEEASHVSISLRYSLEQLVDEVECSVCNGSRLRPDASAVRFHDLTIEDFTRLPLGALQQTIAGWTLDPAEAKVAGELLREIQNRVSFLVDVGLDYLSLGRPAATLSNGEAQRIRLASQLGSGLCGILYVLDEPTIGLHPRDNRRLLNALHKLRDLGNTLIVVEHDREVIEECDYLCDFGPGAGKLGGEITAAAAPQEIAASKRSVTGPYLSGRKAITIPTNRRSTLPKPDKKDLLVRNARHNNLKNIDVRIPSQTLTAITGPSGSGKSSLVEDILYPALARLLHRAAVTPGAHDALEGVKQFNKVIRVDQQPLGNSPSSNPATYTGVFELIRDVFTQVPAARVRGYSSRNFSFNVSGGRCEVCEGNGQKRIEMHFLPDVWVKCETCHGKRYDQAILDITYRNRSISDVLEMTCREALELFDNIPKIRRILRTLCDVGLDYLTLGQSAPTLSGGEAQRVKLAAELSRPDTGKTIYLLDEPTTGLHFDDVQRLLDVMHRLVDMGNTVVVIEHNQI
ncbi:MAG: excinuclease ABC subunit UvrA, partial [Planctomycetota bacterium]